MAAEQASFGAPLGVHPHDAAPPTPVATADASLRAGTGTDRVVGGLGGSSSSSPRTRPRRSWGGAATRWGAGEESGEESGDAESGDAESGERCGETLRPPKLEDSLERACVAAVCSRVLVEP